MIENISIDEAIEILGPCKDERSFEEKYIPSKDVREKIETDKWVFSDRDRAAIIWNSDRALQVKYADLISIMHDTGDERLRAQISERLRYDAVAVRLFDNNSEGYVYATNTNEYLGEDNIIGYFNSMKLSYAAGKKEGYSFKIEKFQIFGDNTVKVKNRSIVSPILAKTEDKQIEEIDIPGSPVATMEYDKNGKLTNYWTDEVAKEDEQHVESLGRHRFENTYVVFPNPFELGEYVRVVGKNAIGRVDESQAQWLQHVKRALEEDAIDDYSDASITIRYDSDKWDHHFSPIYLERVVMDSDYSRPIVLSGHDSGDSFWIRPVEIEDTEEQIYLNEVEELDDELSIPSEYVSGVVLEIFKRYLDMELSYNKRRIRFDYDSNGKGVNSFGMDMVHNFYDAEHVERIASNLIAVSLYICDKHYAPNELDISEEVLSEIDEFEAQMAKFPENEQYAKRWDYAEFLRDLADRIMGMISYGKDKETIISIMAP